jgi:predicted nucleotidyltransferase
MISKEKISEIVNKIVHVYGPDKVILFGSYANGEPTEDSDIDLIIIKNTSLPKQKRGLEIRKYLFGSLVPMDLKIYTPTEYSSEIKNPYSFLNAAMKNSQTLYERKS